MSWLAELGATHWLVFGLVLLAAEAAVGVGYLLGPGVAALLVALLVLNGFGAEVQWFVFAVASVAFSWGYIRYFRNAEDHAAADGLHDRTSAMVGKETRLATGIEGSSRIAFGDTLWRVYAAEPIASGRQVRVTGVEDGVLQVEDADKTP